MPFSQFGGGAITAATQTVFTPGPFKETGLNTDIAIDGDGFLVLQDANGRNFYTCDGELKFAAEVDSQTGQQYVYLIHQSGLKLMAYDISQVSADSNNSDVPSCSTLTEIKIPQMLSPQATTEIYTQEGANIDPRSQIVNKTFDPTDAISYNASYNIQVYYSQGKAYDADIFFVKLPVVEVSEIKTAFEIVFLLYLPFLVVDVVVATILIGLGIFMLPPTVISLPLKIILFVLVNGWELLALALIKSYNIPPLH